LICCRTARDAIQLGRVPSGNATLIGTPGYRDGAIFAAKFADRSAREELPQGAEIAPIIEGSTTLHLITEEERQTSHRQS